MTSEHPHKSYLGDGAYVQQGNFATEIVLTAENGVAVQSTIVLDEETLASLLRWCDDRGLLDNPIVQSVLERRRT